MFIRVFGRLSIETVEGVVALPRGKIETLLRALLVRPNETIGAEELIDRVWPDASALDPAARKRLYVLVGRLRRFLDDAGQHDSVRAGQVEIVTDHDGYRLVAEPVSLDRLAFEAFAEVGLAADTVSVDQIDAAMELWRGEPYEDFPDSEDVRAAQERLLDLRHRLLRRDASSAGPEFDLAQTRLLRPSTASGLLVRRTELVDRMGAAGDATVVVVAAPAGYGKTLLLAQWAEMQQGSVAWVSLEPDDDDPVRAWSAVARSLRSAGVVAEFDLPDDAAPASPRFIAAVANAIDAAVDDSGPLGLVLDDAHHLANPSVLASLLELHSMTARRLTILIGTRSPNPPLGSVAERVVVLDADDLRFTTDEIEELAERTGLERADELESITDGWPIAASYLCRSGSGLSRLDPARITLDSYIVTEVLDWLPHAVRRFLIETAPLDWLAADLCDKVTGRADAASHLELLRAHHVLLVEGPGGTEWHRCHPVVRTLLLALAESDTAIDVAAARRRAGRWFAAAGMPERALEYAIAGADDGLVAELSGEVVDRAIAAPQLNACTRWMQAIDPDVVAVNRGAHDFLTVAASFWLGPDGRSRWERSRRRHFGDDDLMLMATAATDAYREGRASECVALAERALARADAYFGRHRSFPGYRERFHRYVEMRRTCGRMLAGAIDADAAELHALATEASSAIPAMSLWLYGEWAFLALVEGRHELAANLIDGVADQLAAVDTRSAHLIAGRLVVARALVESAATDDPSHRRELIDRLHLTADDYRQLRWTCDLVPVLLALHVAESRGGDRDAAIAARDEADLLLTILEDVPLLVRARTVLDPELSRRTDVGVRPLIDDDEYGLTDRERTVLTLLVEGLTYREIAQRIELSPHTVSGYVRSVYRKLGVRSRQGAMRRMRGVPGAR